MFDSFDHCEVELSTAPARDFGLALRRQGVFDVCVGSEGELPTDSCMAPRASTGYNAAPLHAIGL